MIMKKTLIINGSPRKKGETSQTTAWIRERLEGEVREIFTYDAKFRPCVDCRYCFDHPTCCVKDEMQEIYEYLLDCDNILIASPIYFSELTGSFLNLASRFQPYFCGKYIRHEASPLKPKTGAVLVMFGGKPLDPVKPYDTGSKLLQLLNAQDILPLVYGDHTDDTPALDQEKVLEGAAQIVAAFNR